MFSNLTEAVDFAFWFTTGVSIALMVLITVLMVVFVVKYNHKRHPVAAETGHNAALEIVWTVVPTILALSMFYFGWIGYKMMRVPPADAMEVTATARMWSWSYEYENGKKSSELYVPVGSPVKVNLESGDVLHSFYVPAFRVKQDCVPGMTTFVWFEPEEIGEYTVFCAEFCGQRHSYMLSKVVAVEPGEFAAWVETDVEEIVIDESADEEQRTAQLIALGQRLSRLKGCEACHTVDGTKLVGPSYQGAFGATRTVVSDGQTRVVTMDEAYIRRSILEPAADVVDGYQPVMPSQQGLVTDEEITALTEYIKSLK